MKRLLVFLSIVTITVVAGYLYSVDTKQSISIGSFTSVVLAPELPLPIIDPRKEGIRFVGDIMLARSVEKLMNKYGYMYPYIWYITYTIYRDNRV